MSQMSQLFSISHSAEVKMFDGCLEWLQEQEEATVYTCTITSLHQLRDWQPKKRLGTLK